MNFFNFLIDPQSFGQTVENVFHFAFLIKDGQAAVTIGEDGVPLAGNIARDSYLENLRNLLIKKTTVLDELRESNP